MLPNYIEKMLPNYIFFHFLEKMLPNDVRNVQRKTYIALCLLVKLLILMTSLLDHTEGMKTLSIFVLYLLCEFVH